MTKVVIKNRPNGAYNGEEWPEVGESIDLPDFIAEGMLASGDVVKPGTTEAKDAKAEAAEDEKNRKAAEAAQAKVDAAKAAAAEAEENATKVETAVAQQSAETATVGTTTVRKTTAPKTKG